MQALNDRSGLVRGQIIHLNDPYLITVSFEAFLHKPIIFVDHKASNQQGFRSHNGCGDESSNNQYS